MSDRLYEALQRHQRIREEAYKALGYDPLAEPREPPRIPRLARDKRNARHLAVMLLRERDGTCCYLCKRELDVDQSCIEHIIPIVHGGENEPHNIALACYTCNAKKNERAVAFSVSSGAPAYYVVR